MFSERQAVGYGGVVRVLVEEGNVTSHGDGSYEAVNQAPDGFSVAPHGQMDGGGLPEIQAGIDADEGQTVG
jgi:hypothetical protein